MNANLTVNDHYQYYFFTRQASTPQLQEQAYSVRYSVYCEELKKLQPKSATELQETDDWDQDAIHSLLFYKKEQKPIGNIRLIHCRDGLDKKLPIETYYQHPFDFSGTAIKDLREGKTGEISRMALLSSFRRRPTYKEDYVSGEINPILTPEQRRFPTNYLPMCLTFAAIAMMLEQKLDYGVALMEPRLAKLLVRFGVELQSIGQPIDHFGLRIPYLIFPETSYRQLTPDYRCLFDTISLELKISEQGD